MKQFNQNVLLQCNPRATAEYGCTETTEC